MKLNVNGLASNKERMQKIAGAMDELYTALADKGYDDKVVVSWVAAAFHGIVD